MVVSKLLRDTKVRIDTALSGAEALRKTLNIRYDVIFMDHLMPEMDGIECRRRILDQTGGRSRETSIVILTANADEENRALYARENFDGYLVKPVSGSELENELYRLLPKDIVHITGNRTEIAEETISWMNGSKMRKRVVITTESVADLPQELVDKYDIAVLPHKVQTAEGIFKDGKEIDTKGILKYMEDDSHSEVSTVISGQESIDICREQVFDIIFMDHMMGGMDGVEAMKRIRADVAGKNGEVPIVALTANAMSSRLEKRTMFRMKNISIFSMSSATISVSR